ncbi:MAG: CPXCG motif-containing cysteine-rich protein [Candidatus Coatesbacteria bacterium]
MILKVTTKVRCPHCGKSLIVNLDLSQPEDTWIEDCPICKQSIHYSSAMANGKLEVTAQQTK